MEGKATYNRHLLAIAEERIYRPGGRLQLLPEYRAVFLVTFDNALAFHTYRVIEAQVVGRRCIRTGIASQGFGKPETGPIRITLHFIWDTESLPSQYSGTKTKHRLAKMIIGKCISP